MDNPSAYSFVGSLDNFRLINKIGRKFFPEVLINDGLKILHAPVSNVLFAATIVLSPVGASEKATIKPVFDFLLGAVVSGHTIGAGIMLYDMLFRKKKLCMYCLIGAGVIFPSASGNARLRIS